MSPTTHGNPLPVEERWKEDGTIVEGGEGNTFRDQDRLGERTVRLGDEARGWEAVEELVGMNQAVGGQEAAKGCLALVLFFFVVGILVTLLGEDGSLFVEWGTGLMAALSGLMVCLYTIAFITDFPDTHPGIRASLGGTLLSNQEQENTDWFQLLPYPGTIVLNSSLRFMATSTLKGSVPWWFVVFILLLSGDLEATLWAILFTLGVFGVFVLPFAVSVCWKYGLPFKRRAKT